MTTAILCLSVHLCAQQTDNASSQIVFDALWPEVEVIVNQNDSEALSDIELNVHNLCSGDYICMDSSYLMIMESIERNHFNIPMAIIISKLKLENARKESDVANMAASYIDLNRYHDANGDVASGTIYLDSALISYEKINDIDKALWIRFTQLERIDYLKENSRIENLKKMQQLLDEAEAKANPEIQLRLHEQAISFKINSELYNDVFIHLHIIEKLSKEVHPEGMPIYGIMELHRYRALAYAGISNFEKARIEYRKGIEYARKIPDRWREAYMLNNLADVEQEIGNFEIAKLYLDTSLTVAEQYKILDLQSSAYKIRTIIAEKEGDYKEAYFSSIKGELHNNLHYSQSKDFNLEGHYLQLENEKLEAIKKNKELELDIKRNQLRNSIIIGILGILLSSLSIIAFISQRRRRKELSEQNELIMKQTEELASLDRAKSRFFANVSHELRTPLTLILSPLQTVIKKDNIHPDHLKLLNTAEESTHKLLKLVSSILDLSKMESDQLVLDEKIESFHPLLTRIAYSFESLAISKGIRFSMDYHLQKNLNIKIDKEKLETILYNFLSNAMKYTPKNGEVHVAADTSEGMIRIGVSDTGKGIHPDDIPHIFDRFFQSNQKDAVVEGGTGIGLALVSELAKLMGGKVSVDSTLGKGSTFYLQLPCNGVQVIENEHHQITEQAPILNTNQLTHPQSLGNGSQSSILVVEDHSALREYIGDLLSPYYQIITAENGVKALDILNRNQNINLIVSDIMMPEMDGFQLLDHLKSHSTYQHIPVIMLTARADIQDKLKALRVGVDDYLLKPFVEEELQVRIQNLLRNYAQRKEANKDSLPQEADKERELSARDKTWLIAFETYIRDHISDSILSIPMISNEFAMSESTLLRQLKRLTGLSTKQYIQEMRLNQARIMIDNDNHLSVGQIAALVGYSDVSNFSRRFKKRFGKNPSQLMV